MHCTVKGVTRSNSFLFDMCVSSADFTTADSAWTGVTLPSPAPPGPGGSGAARDRITKYDYYLMRNHVKYTCIRKKFGD